MTWFPCIQWKNSRGKFGVPSAGDKASGLIHEIVTEWGWSFFILWLKRYAIRQAEECSEKPEQADQWYERYRHLRAMK